MDEEEGIHTPHDKNRTKHNYRREQPFATPQNHSAEGTAIITQTLVALLEHTEFKTTLLLKLRPASSFSSLEEPAST